MNYEILELAEPQYAWFKNSDKPTVENFNIFGKNDYEKSIDSI